jgi:nucleotide-binding universal stress UspA family protein
MKKILVPIDFSGDSINALEHAITIANTMGSDIRMVHVKKSKSFDVPFYYTDVNLTEGKSLEDFFKMIINKYKASFKGKFDYKIREGKIYREITNQAKYDDTDLIIMGTHGVSGFEELWMGSNAFRVVSNAPCPVMTIRKGCTRKVIKKIVLPIDLSSETRKKVPVAAELAAKFGATIHVLSIAESSAKSVAAKLQNYCGQVEEYLKERKIKVVRKDLVGSNKTDAIIKYATENKTDLICIMTEQTENEINLFLGDYAQQMVNHSSIPVLSVRSAY